MKCNHRYLLPFIIFTMAVTFCNMANAQTIIALYKNSELQCMDPVEEWIKKRKFIKS